MLPFSTFAAQFPGVSSRVVPVISNGKPTTRKAICIETSAAGAFDMFDKLYRENESFRRHAKSLGGEWSGYASGETPESFISGRCLPSALAAAKAAKARINAPLARSAPVAAFVGPAFSVGRLLQGHPKACYTRPRSKLPPKTFTLNIGYPGHIRQENIDPTFATIAKGITEYTLRGGIATVRLAFPSGLNGPNNGHDAVILFVDVPATNLALLSAVTSLAFERGLNMALGMTLSSLDRDSLRVLHVNTPGTLPMLGELDRDAETVAKMGLTGTP